MYGSYAVMGEDGEVRMPAGTAVGEMSLVADSSTEGSN